EYIRTREFKPSTMLGIEQLVNNIASEASQFRELKDVPQGLSPNLRNDMYVTSEALRLVKATGTPVVSDADWGVFNNYRKHIDSATKFIPTWVKVAVAMALGLGTMVGWKRIVVTVGEKIGKQHLTYAQGAVAEIITMGTIGGADQLGLPVST